MKRLIKGLGKNSSYEYDRIFDERLLKGVNWQDLRRWETLLKYYKGGNILDVGCLDSQIWKLAQKKFPNCVYMGTDVARESIKTMRRLFPHPNCDFVVDNIYESNVKDEVADYVVLGEVLEHLEDPETAIRECFRILKPKGILAISVPLDEAKEPGAVDHERHIWSYTKQDIINLVTIYSSKIKTKVLRSQKFPYKYCWPGLIVYATKKS